MYTINKIANLDNSEGFAFQVKRNGVIFNEYYIDVEDQSVSWYSNFNSGQKHFETGEQAKTFALKKYIHLKQHAIELEKSIATS